MGGQCVISINTDKTERSRSKHIMVGGKMMTRFALTYQFCM